jgi:hypothetical protein
MWTAQIAPKWIGAERPIWRSSNGYGLAIMMHFLLRLGLDKGLFLLKGESGVCCLSCWWLQCLRCDDGLPRYNPRVRQLLLFVYVTSLLSILRKACVRVIDPRDEILRFTSGD